MRIFTIVLFVGLSVSLEEAPPVEGSFVRSYCRWLERCSSFEDSKEKCWQMPIPDTCRRELAVNP